MRVIIEESNTEKEIELKKPETLKNILKRLKILNSSSILVKNDKIVLEDEIVENTDTITILTVVSGG